MEEKTFKSKFEELSYKAKWKAYDLTKWCKNHKEVLIAFGPTVISCSVQIILATKKGYKDCEEKTYGCIYDGLYDLYYELKRQPKKSEWVIMTKRKNNGEFLGDILQDMNLLKRIKHHL